jgi:hypothetical protein
MTFGIGKYCVGDKMEEILKKPMKNITLSGNYSLLAEIQLQAYLVGRNF